MEQAHALSPKNLSGMQCFLLLAHFYDRVINPDHLCHQMGLSDGVFGRKDILLAARKFRFKSQIVNSDVERLDQQTPLPAIACMKDGRFVLFLKKPGDGQILIQRPDAQEPELWPMDKVLAEWDGDLILITTRESLIGALRKFDIKWFIPEFVRYRGPFLDVLALGVGLMVLQLAVPVIFQQVVDRVLVHQVESTLYSISIAYLLIILFTLALNMLRSAVLVHTSCKIDVGLGAKLFSHLIRLPLGYFETRQTGQTVARVHELNTIREFLTGSALSLVLDIPFILGVLIFMWVYSGMLTLVVLAALVAYICFAVVITPRLYHLTEETFEKGAINQNFLVESVYSVETVKSIAVEPSMERDWGRKLASFAETNARAYLLNNMASHIVQAISMLTMLGILFFGTYRVFANEMTVGALIAFNMLAGQVSQPILRLAQIWQQFQQARVGVARLGDILNTPQEERGNTDRATMPTIKGHITFDHVQFRYPTGQKDVLDDVSLDIQPGEIVGIIGPSGSGKSTLAKLIQRSYTPTSGQVRVDGMDLAVINPDDIRRRTGVVLQENTLFHKSVRDNIALGHPTATSEEVIHAAELAGADGFVRDMPFGYDTMIEERGMNLSGGQRQRLAIARVLVTNPQMLIFDEATSALDYESEAAIQANMREICAGRTVIIITHRLATLGFADRIISLERGRIIEDGTPQELRKQDGFYTRMLALSAQAIPKKSGEPSQ